jgi:hypothetical protein
MIACTDGGPAAADAVTMVCGGIVGTTTENVKIVMAGPAAGTTTVQGLNFDVTYDPAKLQFVPAASYASPLFPSALVVVALANGAQGRVVVSIQQTGGTNLAVAPGQHDVLTLSLQRAAGASFTPIPVVFENSDATGAPAVTFTGSLMLSYP